MGDIPRGVRLNNLGNIRISNTPWLGKVVPSSDPSFEEFDNVVHGVRAAAKIFCNYNISHGLSTIAQYIQRWAPPSDNNPTDGYTNFVASACGIDPNNVWNILDAGNLGKLLGAVFRFEQGGDYVTEDQINAGVVEALTSI